MVRGTLLTYVHYLYSQSAAVGSLYHYHCQVIMVILQQFHRFVLGFAVVDREVLRVLI